jgi:hypothetical protein
MRIPLGRIVLQIDVAEGKILPADHLSYLYNRKSFKTLIYAKDHRLQR